MKVSKSQKSNYGDSTYLYDTVYELVYHRAFISKDDETDKNYLYCMPSYDEYLFTYGTKSPVSVRVPDLPPDFYTVEYTMSYTM